MLYLRKGYDFCIAVIISIALLVFLKYHFFLLFYYFN